ncbi:MAG TPA: DnaA/Hda family protein [Gemmatales bacterium]|nr:DnaA/Hda family protein [Gemmatales bacterium]HMP60277.1 DnaA/Hda family protein [Gemmatales bacterium]
MINLYPFGEWSVQDALLVALAGCRLRMDEPAETQWQRDFRMTTQERLDQLARSLVQSIGEPRYRNWFRDTSMAFADGILTVGVPNLMVQQWLESKFGKELEAATHEVFGTDAQVRFVVDALLFQNRRREQDQVARAHTLRDVGSVQTAVRKARTVPPRTWLSIDDFVVGPCNRLAYEAARKLLEEAPESPRLLTFYGKPGVGKTHLLEGLYLELGRTLGETALVCLTAEEFMNRFQAALYSKQMTAFRKQFRESHGLFVDNVQFLAGKEATQEEFFHTVDTLIRSRRPVVLTLDAHPKFLREVAPLLVDRLLGGGVWEIETPDHMTRLALLRSKAEHLGMDLPEDAIRFLADRLHGNVRELEGVLNTINHFQQVHRKPLTLALVREATKNEFRHEAKVVSLTELEKVLCRVLNVDPKSLHAATRARAVSHPRMLMMYLARRLTGASYYEISRFFGAKSHSTVIAAEKKVKQWLADDANLFSQVDRCPVREVVENVERELFQR